MMATFPNFRAFYSSLEGEVKLGEPLSYDITNLIDSNDNMFCKLWGYDYMR